MVWSRTSRLAAVSWIALAFLSVCVVEAGWLFAHYVYPGQPLRAQVGIHLVVLCSGPVAGTAAMVLLSTARIRVDLGRGAVRVCWGVWVACCLVGAPLWALGFVV
jgi:hypothetical protein